MQLDTRLLAKALRDLHAIEGRGFWTELEQETGTHNLARLARGTKGVTFETWLKLHKARPDDIPPPTTVGSGASGGVNVVDDGNPLTGNAYSQGGNIYKQGSGRQWSPEIIELMEILSDYVAPIEVRKLLKKYRKVKRDIENDK